MGTTVKKRARHAYYDISIAIKNLRDTKKNLLNCCVSICLQNWVAKRGDKLL